jgi:mannose-1-phosphate guanylyltransferase
MILAAGYGTRLRPLTWTLPKPAVPVCNRPLIAWAVDNFLRAGVDEIIVNLHHLPEAIERFLHDEYAGRCSFAFSRETEILGTGGGIRKVRPLLEGEREFFLANGDTIQFPPLDSLRAARHASDALATLTLRHPPPGDQFTAVYFEHGSRGDLKFGTVTGFETGTGEAMTFSGCHCLSTRVFRYLPDRDFSGIVADVYQPLVAAGRETLAAIIDDGLWFDIGKPQRYLAASAGLIDAMIAGSVAVTEGSRLEGTSIVHATARVSGRIERSTVGRRSVVEGNLDGSFVWDDCRIARGAKLISCIVGHGVEIAKSMTIENAMICRDEPDVPRDPGYRFENGLVIAPIA